MGKWQSLALGDIVPSEVTKSLSLVTNVVDEFLKTYKIAIQVAKLYQKTLSGGVPDVLHELVQAVVDLVEGLLQAGKIHLLFVPIGKQFPTVTPVTVPLSLDDVGYQAGIDIEKAGIAFSGDAHSAYAALAGGTGGNQGFYTTFLSALNDQFDVNRPQYNNEGDAVVMSVLMLGAPSLPALIESAAAFTRVFQPSSNSDLSARTVPIPQDVAVKVIGVPGGTTIGTRLSWRAPKEQFSLMYFPGVSMSVDQYAVIRSTNPAATKASSVLDFFSTQSIAQGLTSDDGLSTVIAVGSGVNSSWVDSDSLDATQTYYYCVAWKVSVVENTTATALSWDRVSSVVKTRVKTATPTQSSVPPDWEARGSALDLLPDFATQVRVVLEEIKVLADRNTGGASSSIGKALDLIEINIDSFAARISGLNAQAKRLDAIFSTPMPAFYTTTIVGTGGNTFLAGELASRLHDTSDTSRPPYDGSQYIMGICAVAGGPRMPDIQPIVDFLTALLGPSTSNPLVNAIASIDKVVTAAETTVFGQSMTPLPVTTTDGVPTATLPDGTQVPASSINPVTGLPTAANTPVIANDGTAVSSSDPKNPNAGNTNVKPLKDLC